MYQIWHARSIVTLLSLFTHTNRLGEAQFGVTTWGNGKFGPLEALLVLLHITSKSYYIIYDVLSDV